MENYTIQILTGEEYTKEKNKLLSMRNKYLPIKNQIDHLETG